jgi:hypothetical protein
MTIDENGFDAFFDGQIKGLEQSGFTALARLGHATQQLAYENSSGPFGPRDLRQMDHPYAVRHGYSKLPAGILNVGQGRGGDHVRDHWKTSGLAVDLATTFGIPQDPATLETEGVTVYNDSDIANRYLSVGTRYMWRRPVDSETLRDILPMRDTILAKVMQEFEKKS